MATYQYCDHKGHEGEGGQFTPAIVKMDVVKRDEKHPANVLNVTATKDACGAHLGVIVEALYTSSSKDPNFDHIRIFPIGNPRRSV